MERMLRSGWPLGWAVLLSHLSCFLLAVLEEPAPRSQFLKQALGSVIRVFLGHPCSSGAREEGWGLGGATVCGHPRLG